MFHLPSCSDGDKFFVPPEALSSEAFFGGAARKNELHDYKIFISKGFESSFLDEGHMSNPSCCFDPDLYSSRKN